MPVAKVSYYTTTSLVRTVFNTIKFMTKDIIGDGSYIYFARDENLRGRPTKNWKTIRKILKSGEYTYMTFNGYNLPWCGKTSRNLQWIAAITVDIDEKCPVDELLDAVAATGLEAPTLIVETSRGYHLSWKLNTPLRAYPANQVFVQAVTATIIEELQKQGIVADPAYRTPERYTRVPYHVVWFRPTACPLQFFLDWVEINELKLKKGGYRRFGKVAIVGDIINDPAVQKLLEGVRVSVRNESAYALALCFKAEGYSKDEVLVILLEWNKRNEEPLPLNEIRDTVESAFRYNRLPSPQKIKELTGIKPRFRIVRATRRKSAVEEKVVAIIAGNGGELATTFDALAEHCGVSRRTLLRHIQKLKKEGKITVRTFRSGRRGSVTVFSLTTKYNTTEDKSKASDGKFSRDSSKIFEGPDIPRRLSYQRQDTIPNLNCDTLYIRYIGAGGRGHVRTTRRVEGMPVRMAGEKKDWDTCTLRTGIKPGYCTVPSPVLFRCTGLSSVFSRLFCFHSFSPVCCFPPGNLLAFLIGAGRTRGSPCLALPLFQFADQRGQRRCC